MKLSATDTLSIGAEDGYSIAVVQLFRRSAQALGNGDRPTGTLTYTFATGVLSGSSSYFNGWSQSIPAASEGTKLYVTMATARSQGATDTIAASEWSTPVEYVADSMKYASVIIYKRSASQPNDKPANGAIYTFATGGLTGTLNGWSTAIPATDGNPCWVRHATAVSSGTTDTIDASEWSNPAVKLVEDGKDGNPNILLRTIFDKYGADTVEEKTASIGFVKEKWTLLPSNDMKCIFPGQVNTSYNGKRSLRFNSSEYSGDRVEIKQNVLTRIKPGTWYTLSFYLYTDGTSGTSYFYTYISGGVLDTTVRPIVDGVEVTGTVPGDGSYRWPHTGGSLVYHTYTFKTKADFTGLDANVYFRAYRTATINEQTVVVNTNAAICIPKLEEGQHATPYVPNDDDLIGDGAPVATVTPGSLTVECENTTYAYVNTNVSQSLVFGLAVGGQSCADVSAVLKSGTSLPSGVEITYDSNNKVTGITILGKEGSVPHASGNTLSAGIPFTVSGTLSGRTFSGDCTLAIIPSKVGKDGTSPSDYDLEFTEYAAIYDVNTKAFSASFKLYVRKLTGSSSASYITAFTPQFYDLTSDQTDKWTNLTGPSSKLYSGSMSGTLNTMPQSINFRVMNSDGILLATVAMPISIKGAQGELGPMCYIAGICKDDTEYTSNAQQTVAVEVQAQSGTEMEIWYLDAATNKVTISGQTVYLTPSNQVRYGYTIWKKGLNNYNLVRTKYLFADFAKLGEGVVSGDWLFSANGKIDGTAYNNGAIYGPTGKPGYMFFDGQSPLGRRNLGISATLSNTDYERKGNAFSLTAGNKIIKVTGKVNGGIMKVALYDNTQMISGEYSINTTTESSTNIIMVDLPEGSNYILRAKMSSSSYTGTITSVEVITFAPNYAVDLLVGKTYEKQAYIEGEIQAQSGKIGGFSIDETQLTNSNWNAGVDISYDSKVVKIGKNAKGAIATEDAIIRAENNKSKSTTSDTYNTALYLGASGAKYNYAFYGNGNGVLNGYMQGFKVHSISATSASTAVQIKLGDGMIQAVISATVTDALINLPQLGEIKKTLGISGDVDFCCQLIVINQCPITQGASDEHAVRIMGDNRDYTATTTSDTAKPRILRGTGEYYVNVPSRYVITFYITYISKRFIANYIMG